MQTLEDLREKLAEEKDIPLKYEDYKEFSALYYRFNSLGFDHLPKRKKLAFIADG